MKTLREEDQARLGRELADMLQLKLKRNGRYDLRDGDKTDLGLYRTINRCIEDFKGHFATENKS